MPHLTCAAFQHSLVLKPSSSTRSSFFLPSISSTSSFCRFPVLFSTSSCHSHSRLLFPAIAIPTITTITSQMNDIQDDLPKVGFRKSDALQPDSLAYTEASVNAKKKSSAFSQQSNSANRSSPNQRLMAEVEQTRKRLLDNKDADSTFSTRSPLRSTTYTRRPVASVEYKDIDVFQTFAASIGAAGMSYGVYKFLMLVLIFYATNPFQSDFYFVERVNIVMRQVLVTIFALATGIFGVTALGIFLLACRVTYGHVSGEFRNQENNTETTTATTAMVTTTTEITIAQQDQQQAHINDDSEKQKQKDKLRQTLDKLEAMSDDFKLPKLSDSEKK